MIKYLLYAIIIIVSIPMAFALYYIGLQICLQFNKYRLKRIYQKMERMEHISDILEYLSTYAVLSESDELVEDMHEIINKVITIVKLNERELSSNAYIIILDNTVEFMDKNIISIKDDDAKSALFNTIKTIKSGIENLQLRFDVCGTNVPDTDKA